MSLSANHNLAIVVIGRNEGDRLKDSLRSVVNRGTPVVYVDSGSVDGSPELAASLGCRVVHLDSALPFTAARARNEGFSSVMKLHPGVKFIQFLDGDCELEETWLHAGLAMFDQRPDAAVVCGYVHEMRRDASIYNMMCDLEWHQPAGEVLSSGGRFLVRSATYSEVGGFRPDVIAAEDDEFCIRVRALGWKILQVDADMARHDAAITHFSQWWRRATRTGHAYAQVADIHGSNKERYFVGDVRRICFLAFILPVSALCLAPFTHGWSLAVALSVYLYLYLRICQHCKKRGYSAADSMIYSFFTVLYKFPAFIGIVEYYRRRRHGSAARIIEYKRSASRA